MPKRRKEKAVRTFHRNLTIPAVMLLAIQSGVTNCVFSQSTRTDAADTTDVDALLKRLDEIEQESRTAAGRTSGARTSRLAVLFEHSNLWSTNLYTNDGIRYFVTRAILINPGDETLNLQAADFVLLADGREFHLGEFPEQVKANGIYTCRETLTSEQVTPPSDLSVPRGGSAELWLVFCRLPTGPGVPRMKLRISLGAEERQEIDVNEYERGVLGLREERLGPQQCLALLTISGELNTINAASLADDLDHLAGRGIARAVISFGENSTRPADQVWNWLLSARNPQNQQPDLFPVLPASISELHVANVAENAREIRPGFQNGVITYASTEDAVLAALRTACEVIPRDELRRQIVNGLPLTRAAALMHGGSRLEVADLPLVLRAMNDPSEVVRRGAIAALAHFPEPTAVDALMTVVHGDSPTLSTAAMESLASADYPAAHAALLNYLRGAPVAARRLVVEVLSRFPRAEWSDVVYGFASDEDAGLRLAALQALERLGHPELTSLFVRALHDEDEQIRNFAFANLAARNDATSEAAAMDYALELLKSEPPNGTVTSLLNRTRDQRAMPLLMRYLDKPGDHRAAVIQLVARVGGSASIDTLVARYPDFTHGEQAVALDALYELSAPQARQFALEAVVSSDQGLASRATKFLIRDGDQESVRALADVLRSGARRNWRPVCTALRMIGTREAREALLEARRSDDPNKQSCAADALLGMNTDSPAFNANFQGELRIREQKHDQAEELFTLAIQFDPEFAPAYSNRGFARLRMERLPEAKQDFAQAVELDPFDAQGVTGLAIVHTMQGEYLEGIRIVTEAAPHFAGNSYFAYNSACVYGVAVKQLTDADTPKRNAKLIREYQDQAIELLKQAVEQGFDDWETFRTDSDLDALRDLDEFRKLLPEGDPDTTESEAPPARPAAEQQQAGQN